MANQVFISYRREGGGDIAQLIQERLKYEGYSVFLDINSIHRGKFDKKILVAIEECDDFIFILSKGALDRCVNEGDWVRAEIRHALLHNKNIIPIILPGATFPSNLPADIDAVRGFNGIDYNRMHFDSVIHMLMHEWMVSPVPVKATSDFSPFGAQTKGHSPKARPTKKMIILSVAAISVVSLLALILSVTGVGKRLFCSHSYTETIVPPTCTEVGYTSMYCPKCEMMKKNDFVAETGHVFGESIQTKAPSCTDGGTEYRNCLVCSYVEQSSLNPTGHIFREWIIDKESTNGEAGSKHAFCEVCGSKTVEAIFPSGSKGLSYAKNGDQYMVVGVGSCNDTEIIIAPMVDGLPVTKIASQAFMGNTKIVSVTIPEGVTSIEKEAFSRCTSLKEIRLPSTLKSIEKRAFFICSSLENVVIPEGVTRLGNYAFAHCVSMKGFTMPKSIEQIGYFCFINCVAMESMIYEGTTSEWDKIKCKWGWSSGTFNYTIYCTNGQFTVFDDAFNPFK